MEIDLACNLLELECSLGLQDYMDNLECQAYKDSKEKWIDFVNEHGIDDWINCWSPYSNDFRAIYNLQSYPQLFIFDRDKKIVAKRITPEQAEKIINNLIASNANNNT